MISHVDLADQQPTPNKPEIPGMHVLEHAVGLLVLGSFEGNDPTIRTKLMLGVIIAADAVTLPANKDRIELISDAKSRVVSRIIEAEPDVCELYTKKRLNLKKVRKEWNDFARLAYSKLIVNDVPRGMLEVDEIQQAILNNSVDFDLSDEVKVAA